MRLIPRNTKVKLQFYKGITLTDIILALVCLALVAITLASNFYFKYLIALGVVCVFIPWAKSGSTGPRCICCGIFSDGNGIMRAEGTARESKALFRMRVSETALSGIRTEAVRAYWK